MKRHKIPHFFDRLQSINNFPVIWLFGLNYLGIQYAAAFLKDLLRKPTDIHRHFCPKALHD